MNKASILPGIWHDRLAVNAETSIYHQWKQLEASGCIENFRIAAGEVEGFREGWFFADSDAFKWLDAAARIYDNIQPNPRLAALMDEFIELIGRAQQPDGYIYTYNQIHFPNTRWENLQIEHELYCHGHLIEAGVSHYNATGQTALLDIAAKAADRIVADFKGKGPEYTPGHQEIEIALMKLYRITSNISYLEMTKQFIEQRGKTKAFGLSIFQQNTNVGKKEQEVKKHRQAYLEDHPEFTPFEVPTGNHAKHPWNAAIRWMLNAFNGKYFQQHIPVSEQTIPVGHSVRFAYLETATAMLEKQTETQTYLPTLERAWEHMVTRRMYVTGGIGSLPALEGFGRDYELDPEFAYAETCAALGCMFWNWEMVQLTGKAPYSDLFEWQLYNAAGVGMGEDGISYLYNNPLACRGGVTRQEWYEIPCCPSNLSRTWADLGSYLYSQDKHNLWVHQFINSELELEFLSGGKLVMNTGLPWHGSVQIDFSLLKDSDFTLQVRIPSWASKITAKINGKAIQTPVIANSISQTASGFDPRPSQFWPLQRTWTDGDVLEIDFGMEIKTHSAHPKVKDRTGKRAISFGPIVYCLESVDNPGVDIFSLKAAPDSLQAHYAPELLGGINIVKGKTVEGAELTFIPYHLWGNRGPSQMNVWGNMIQH